MSSNEKSTATFLHISTLSQYFFPFGNFIFPLIIWGAKKEQSEFVNQNGKKVLNFQLSLLLYAILLLIILVPIVIYCAINNPLMFESFDDNCDFNFHYFKDSAGLVLSVCLAVLLLVILKIAEFIFIIIGAVKASEGQIYSYPLSINFIK